MLPGRCGAPSLATVRGEQRAGRQRPVAKRVRLRQLLPPDHHAVSRPAYRRRLLIDGIEEQGRGRRQDAMAGRMARARERLADPEAIHLRTDRYRRWPTPTAPTDLSRQMSRLALDSKRTILRAGHLWAEAPGPSFSPCGASAQAQRVAHGGPAPGQGWIGGCARRSSVGVCGGGGPQPGARDKGGIRLLRAAVVGAGSRATSLMTRITSEGLFTLAAVVEPVAERRHAAVAQFAVPLAVPGVDELLAVARPGLDCVFVVTPPWLHAEAFVAVANAGLPIFCEKPMDMDLRAAERMRHAARANGIRSMFGFNRRFTPVGRLARALCAAEPPRFVHASKSRPMTYSRMLAENAVHAVDLLLCLADSTPETIKAVATFKDGSAEAEAYVGAVLSFVGGGGGSFQMITEGAGGVERVEVYGRDYTLVGDLPDQIRYAGDTHGLREAARTAGVTLESRGGERFEVRGEPDLVVELSAFAALVQGTGLPTGLPGVEAAFEAQRVVEAIYRDAGLPPTHWAAEWVREQ